MSEIANKYTLQINPKESQQFPSMLKNSFNLKWIKGIFDMKKSALILVFLLIFINACQTASETKKSETNQIKTLSDIQITACNTAHDAGTCDTRLAELGIVLKEDCCQVLGKCC